MLAGGRGKNRVLIITVNFDGAYLWHRAIGSYGYHIRMENNGQIREFKDGGLVPSNIEDITHNVSEYYGLREAMLFLCSKLPEIMEGTIITIKGDSNLVIQQINGRWRANAKMKPLRDECLRLEALLREKEVMLEYVWVNREQNVVADRLSKRALDGRV